MGISIAFVLYSLLFSLIYNSSFSSGLAAIVNYENADEQETSVSIKASLIENNVAQFASNNEAGVGSIFESDMFQTPDIKLSIDDVYSWIMGPESCPSQMLQIRTNNDLDNLVIGNFDENKKAYVYPRKVELGKFCPLMMGAPTLSNDNDNENESESAARPKIDRTEFNVDSRLSGFINSYPFDSYEAATILLVEQMSLHGFVHAIPPNVTLSYSSSSEWNFIVRVEHVDDFSQLTIKDKNYRADLGGTLLIFKVNRPVHVRILTVLIPLILLVFYYAIYKVEDSGAALEASLGVLFGLWSMNEIVIVDQISGFTIAHMIIVTQYVLFASVVAFRFLWLPQWQEIVGKIHVGEAQVQAQQPPETVIAEPRIYPAVLRPNPMSENRGALSSSRGAEP